MPNILENNCLECINLKCIALHCWKKNPYVVIVEVVVQVVVAEVVGTDIDSDSDSEYFINPWGEIDFLSRVKI